MPTPADRPAREPSFLQTYWQDIQRGAADAMRMPAMMASLTTHHHGPVDNSQTSHTQVGAIHVHTPATDGSTVAADLRRDLQRNGLLGQADYGLA